MPVDELLTALDPLPYRERMRRLAAWARTAPDRAEVCAELILRGDYERQLALVAAMVARDAAGIAAAASSPQPLLRAGLFDRRITELSARDRRKTYRTLRHLDDTATADRLIREVRAHFSDDEAAALLPACGASIVREMLPDLEYAANLEVVARRHPAILLARAGERLAAAPVEQRRTVWDEVGTAVLACDPVRVLDLLERYPVEDFLPGALTAYGRLAAADPGRVARLLVAQNADRPLPPAVLRRLVVLPNEELAPLAQTHLVSLLRFLPPSRRAGLASDGGVPSVRVMELLPVRDRVREAARVLDRVPPPLRAKFRSYLAWDDVSEALLAATRTGDAAERERAWSLFIGAARRSRDPRAVTVVIGHLDRLRNEQDSVRETALHALAGLAFTAESAPALTRMTTAAVEARDTSASTGSALGRLAVRTLRRSFDEPALREWALFTLSRVGLQPLPGLPASVVFERLRGHVPVLALARALGDGAYDVPALQEMLRSLVPTEDRDEAIRLWLADRRHRSQRVEEVLDLDPTAVELPEVWATISSSRTDLLDRFLTPAPPVHVERWLPRQQRAYVQLLSSTVEDRAGALRMAAVVPVYGRELLLRHRDDADGVVAEAALGALPWTDRPDEALSVLLEYADSERARVALYAAGRAAAHTVPSRLPALLGGVLAGPAKVTSRKAAARLLARYAPAEVMSTLLEVLPSAPADVRAAIVSGARQRLDASPSWAILAAGGPGIFATVPGRISARHRPRYAALVADACRRGERGAFAVLPRWLPYVDAADLVAGHIADLDQKPRYIGALLPALVRAGLTPVLGGLIERGTEPARRRIDALVRGTVAWSRSAPSAVDRPALVASARYLADQPSYRPAAAALLVGLARLDNLDELADLCAGHPVLAVRTADLIRDRLGELHPFTDRAAIRRLTERGDLAGGLFAVALLTETRSRWSQPWHELLSALRAHPESEVRDEAYALDATHR